MSMVSRRTFLKCVGAGSAAVASAALLGGCSGGGSSSSGSTSGGNNHSGNGNTGNGNAGNSSSSASSTTNNGASSGTTNSITGDIGKGKQYRPMTSVPIRDYDQNIANYQDVEVMLTAFQNGVTVDDDEDGYVSALLYFNIINNSENIKVPLENPYGDFTEKELMNFTEKAFSGKYTSKYMEVKCGTRIVQTAVLSSDGNDKLSVLGPGQSCVVYLICRFPKDWTSATVKYTLPYDTRKYVNFIVYPSDSLSDD